MDCDLGVQESKDEVQSEMTDNTSNNKKYKKGKIYGFNISK